MANYQSIHLCILFLIVLLISTGIAEAKNHAPNYAPDHTLTFETIGDTKLKDVYLQVIIKGNVKEKETIIFNEKIYNLQTKNNYNITLPREYTNEPISFRITGSKYESASWRVLISKIRISKNGKFMSTGKWHYNETSQGFLGFIGEDNLLLEHPRFGGDSDGYAEFYSDHIMHAPDLKIDYDDIKIIDKTGRIIKNNEVKPGDAISIRIKVHNLGDLKADNVCVGIYDIHWNLLNNTVIAVESNATVNLNWTARPLQKSTFLRIAVDYENNIPESNEFNNRANKIITGPHPYMLFYDYEIPSIRNKIANQAKPGFWWYKVKSNADKYLKNDFTDPGINGIDRSKAAMHLAFAYIITNNTDYASKSREALLYINTDNEKAHRYYGYAYDFLFSYLQNHDGEDVNNNKLSDIAEIQEKLINISIRSYSGQRSGSSAYIPTGFPQGMFPQERGPVSINVGIIMLSLPDYDNRPDYNNISENSEYLTNFILSDFLGYPDYSQWGNTTYYNSEGIGSNIGVMCGAEGMYMEGTYYMNGYWQEGLGSFLQTLKHTGIDVHNVSYIRALSDFYIRTMAPDKTYPIYYTGHRQPFRYMVEIASLYNSSSGKTYMWYWKTTGEEIWHTDYAISILAFDQHLYDTHIFMTKNTPLSHHPPNKK